MDMGLAKSSIVCQLIIIIIIKVSGIDSLKLSDYTCVRELFVLFNMVKRRK